jgi:aspartyl protease family protein
MRGFLCFFIFAAVVCAGLSKEISKALIPTGGSQAASVSNVLPRRASVPPPPPQQVAAGGTVRLESDSRGHFQVDARVDGRPIDFIVDTGASSVVLRESAAAKLGIFPKPSDYTGRTSTANGIARYAPVRLNRIEVSGISVYDVRAAVMPDEALNVNLLGMTFLSRVKFSHDHGRLVLEQ